MMQHKTMIGTMIGSQVRDSFEDRMRRIASVNLRAASMAVTEMHPDSARWFCLQVQKGREFAVEKEMLEANVEAFMPREKWVQVRHGRKIEGERPYLAGYILVRCVPSPNAFHGLRRQRFVVDIVGGSDGRYHVVRDEDVSVFKSLIEKPNVSRMATDKSFGDGDRAEITFGPFAGFTCLVVSVEWCREAWASVVIELSGKVFPISRIPLAFLKKL
tara:strand:- start:29697 stop:30344 length:648 start_codon:yes stop_codon:yes gene_type:complete